MMQLVIILIVLLLISFSAY
ncbi:type I toxin-antitoxin system toxin IbsC [Escherichia coli]|nr:type I toxin-antitoxin system toxin IbsC [Escherichia coli]EEW2027196.1 type I toxin-antitoxin system Ibs family toxin [Escherichia coli]EFH3504162.1 type I toxin-antitoxin system toxin IbsC [Escherichia coli]EGF8086528.1 type I toxin-antitoxin system toxin IbsC [Escherichia coli]EIT2994281.1 type I toxin-antitoxin system toxin IbsC [Escherichia coli]ELH6240083.1 type I toxin-antitoxin system toxin IbsC [Escherichia coli]